MTEGLSLGPLLLRWNGLLLVVGIVAGAMLATREAKRRDYEPEIVYHLFLPLTVWGLIGARLWHIFTPPLSSIELGLTTRYYLSHPVDIGTVWIGGFGFPGVLIGGSIALLFFARMNELSFWELTDILAPGLALAQAISRLGNFFNQELYGLPTNMPWKIFIDPAYRLSGYESVNFYHPLFAYEMILNILNLIILLRLASHFNGILKDGDIFLAYLVVYSLIRFLLEFLRLDIALVNHVNINQVFFAIIFVCVGAGLFLRHRTIHNL